jgi:disulfide bond formation protein DsbB
MRGRAESLIWIVLAVSVLIMATVFWFQYQRDLAPCPLCLYQRWPYLAALPLTVAALVVRREGFAVSWRQALMAVVALGFVAGAAVGVYHVGIEQHWWAGPTSCSGAGAGAQSVDELRAQLMATPVVRCDRVAWSLLGVSLAGFNVLASLGLAVLSAWAALLRRDL